jgi:hypothetical protein
VLHGLRNDVSTTNISTTRWGPNDEGTGLAATWILEVSISKILYIANAFLKA